MHTVGGIDSIKPARLPSYVLGNHRRRVLSMRKDARKFLNALAVQIMFPLLFRGCSTRTDAIHQFSNSVPNVYQKSVPTNYKTSSS